MPEPPIPQPGEDATAFLLESHRATMEAHRSGEGIGRQALFLNSDVVLVILFLLDVVEWQERRLQELEANCERQKL